jgi:hypothetical protein
LDNLSLRTSYDNRDFAAATISGKDKGISNTMYKIFSGPELSTLLLQGSVGDITIEDEHTEDAVEDADVILGCEEDNDDDELEGLELSPQDKRIYKAFVNSTVVRHHATDRDLQCRTASDIACGDGSHAVFVCPCPECEDRFDVDIAVHKFYRHLEHPKHWQFFNATGIPCEFRCGKGFLDETHRLIHYIVGSCTAMAKFTYPIHDTRLSSPIR